MKRTLAAFLTLCMLFWGMAVPAAASGGATALLDCDFSTANSADYQGMTATGSGWTLYGSQGTDLKVTNAYNYLSVGAPYVANGDAGLYTGTFPSAIGAQYTYEISLTYGMSGDGTQNYHIGPENLASGSYYTAKSTITNGAYRLEFSVEADGIYGYNSTGWSKLWNGAGYSDSSTYVSYKAEVEGNVAVIYRNGTKILTYLLPKSLKGDYYSFDVSGNGSGTVNAVAKVKSFALTGIENTLETSSLIINKTIASAEDAAAVKTAPWTLTGSTDKLTYSAPYLKLEGNAGVTALGIATSTFSSPIGKNYYYQIAIKPHGKTSDTRFVGTADSLSVGTYYTNKTVIRNGSYKLEFSPEKEGIYAVNSQGLWSLMYTGSWPSDAAANYLEATYGADVMGDQASIYRNGNVLFTYTLPQDLAADSYSFGLNRNVDAAITYINHIKLAKYPASNYEETPVSELKHFELTFAKNDTSGTTAALKANTNWSIYNGTYVFAYQYGDYISIGHSNAAGKCGMGTSFFASPIGKNYTYKLNFKPYGTVANDRFIDSANLASGNYWTGKTTITNSFYRLELSVEKDGFYGINSAGTWGKLYSTACPADASSNYLDQAYIVTVKGNTAAVYRDGTKLFDYRMPADTAPDHFELTSSSVQYSDAGIFYANNISLTSSYFEDSLDADYAVVNNTLKVTCGSFKENINDGAPYYVLVAAYNHSGEMVGIDFKHISETASFPVALSVDYDTGYQIAVYAWDSFETMKPLISAMDLESLQ